MVKISSYWCKLVRWCYKRNQNSFRLCLLFRLILDLPYWWQLCAEIMRYVWYVHEFLSCLPKDYTCAMCSWVSKVIKEKITMFELHEMLNIFQKIILVQYVHEFLSCLPIYHTCAMCSWVFKVIKEKITMLEQFVQEFLHVYLGENDIPFMNQKNVVSQFSFVE